MLRPFRHRCAYTQPHHPTARPAAARRSSATGRLSATAERGFTLIELLAVIAMIGVLAAASAPSIVYYLRDRRVTDAGGQIAGLYRYARARAMGRGSAVNVRFKDVPGPLGTLNAVSPEARFAVREAIAGGLAAGTATGIVNTENPALAATQTRLGIPNCTGTDWSPDVAQARILDLASMDERRERYYPAVATFYDFVDVRRTNDVDICFTPRGRVWWRPDGVTFVPMNGVPYVRIDNATEVVPLGDASSSMQRKVVIPPSGGARLVTEIF